MPVPYEEFQNFLTKLNEVRRSLGLALVILDAEASQRCQERASALALSPGSENTAEDHPVIFLLDPTQALRDALARTDQRLLFLDRMLDHIGLGIARTESDTWVTVVENGRAAMEPPIIFPANGQRDVPAYFSGGAELPERIGRQNAGFPITVTFPKKTALSEIHWSLMEGNDVVPCDLVKDKSFAGIGLLPKSPLKSNTTYRVAVDLRAAGKPWKKTWLFTTCDDAGSQGVLADKALAKINEYRRSAGLGLVVLDPKLSQGCRSHARYLTINAEHPSIQGLGAHEEQRHLPGYTPEGERAAKGVIADGLHDPLAALDAWMATLYHRIPLLDPRLTRIGFGCALGQRQTWVSVLDVTSGRGAGSFKIPVVYPAHSQKNVPLCFSGNEIPDPIPEDKDGKAGFPVTVTFAHQKLARIRTSFKDATGQEVPVWFSSPDKPANPRYVNHQGNTVCLIAQEPLRPNTTYEVQLSGDVEGRPWSYTWSFTTGNGGISPAQAAEQVVQRINFYRGQAGLAKVTLDSANSKSCEAHARYLLLNAGRLSAKKFNDEDPQLPGFTPAGQAAARSTAVFFHAPDPLVQIDTMMAGLQRSYVLDPALRHIGFGCGLELGRGWACVLDLHSGLERASPILFPVPDQTDVPCAGLEGGERTDVLGYPITVSFPAEISVNDFQARLTDERGTVCDVRLSLLENGTTMEIVPRVPLRAATTYHVAVSARLNTGHAWRQSWRFATGKIP